MTFIDALQSKDRRTENGMPTHSTSGEALVDLFYRLGATRNEERHIIVQRFWDAWKEDNLKALKLLFYARDIRGGQGERRFFRETLKEFAYFRPQTTINNLHNIVEFGRWDDLLVILDNANVLYEVKEYVADFILSALKKGDKLCAKWMPRENKKNAHIAKFLREQWKLTPKNYRKLLAGNTEVVENLMCRNDWESINYEHVPSVAMNKYKTAFFKHDLVGMTEYVDAVKKGEKKINSSILYPSDIVCNIRHDYTEGMKDLTQAQWDALPNFVKEGETFIPIVDTSGSMYWDYNKRVQAGDIANSLALYLSERNVGPFKDAFITFNSTPQLIVTKGSLYERVKQISQAPVGGNTNLEAVFSLILGKAAEANLPKEDMPQTIVILSDMQFDGCVINPKASAMEMIKEAYHQTGYEVPKVIFWNLRNSVGVPAKHNETGTLLVSGYSPSLMKEVLGMQTPLELVLKIINSERYERITL